jgi:2-amino-4-hydroxy-6-hydroxymethyldihydropteridine diphosphokinase
MAELTYIALGSNIGDRLAYLRSALTALHSAKHMELISVSDAYETAPQGYADQADFLNAACSVYTSLTAQTLLELLQRTENDHQRIRHIHWGPRTLDLDLLLYGEQIQSTHSLTLPHPYICRRDFVLVPLCQIAPQLLHPQSGRPFASYLSELDTSPLHPIAELTLTPSHADA